MSAHFRVMAAQDVPEAQRLSDQAGWNQTALVWQRFLSASPQGCFVAEHRGLVIGTSATIVFEGKLAWVGMVIVSPEYRGRGIGKALLQRAIDYLDEAEIACIKLDATPQGRPLYEKFGFVGECEIERWMLKRGSSSAVPSNSVPAMPDLQDVLDLDARISGAGRAELLRSVALAAPDLTLVSRHDATIEGYAFGRHGSRADQLGPWMARNRSAAAALLDEFLRRSYRELIFVDCLQDNCWAVPLVKSRAFEFQRSLTRMFRGANLAGQPEMFGAILGPEFG